LNIDESRGLTLPSQNQRNYNQHANSTRPSFSPSHIFQPRQGTTCIFTSHQQQAFSSTMRPYTSNNNRPQNRPITRPNNPSPAQPRPNHDRRPTTHQDRPFQQQNCGTRPPFRPTSSNNTNQRRPPNSNNAARQNPSTSNTANIVCNNCGRLGHYANRCITANRQPQTSNNN
jgi:hypothetical protein